MEQEKQAGAARSARDIITGYKGPKVRIMEVCGTHTHEIFRLGIRRILPAVQHSLCQEEIDAIGAWLKKVLA